MDLKMWLQDQTFLLLQKRTEEVTAEVTEEVSKKVKAEEKADVISRMLSNHYTDEQILVIADITQDELDQYKASHKI